MKGTRRAAVVVLSLALTVSSAGAYYHFIHYTSKTAPYLPVPDKYDLDALPNKTVTFFVSDSGPTQYSPNDSFPSVLSQVRQAARAWNAVSTSDLRVSFGGLQSSVTQQSTPGGEVIFDDDIPPGLLAFSTHTAQTDPVTKPDGSSFFPIVQSLIHLKSDLTDRPGPSYTDGFYLTVVHEMGHALGLQHTFTSSVMATAVTRATSARKPLDADDIAAISLLYPRNFAGQMGTITGTVTAGDQGVHMASVVALRPNGSSVSALTNPDGTFRIDGVAGGVYYVYAHPLPPSANVIFPLDPDGNPVNPSGPFNTVFYPNASSLKQASTVTVKAGAVTDGINFSVTNRSSVPVYDVATYSYFGQSAVHPAYVNAVSGSATIAAAGVGVGTNGQVAPGLGLSILGSSFLKPGGLRAYGATPTYLAIDLGFTLAAATGPQHFVFSQGSTLYVLPGAMNLVSSDPPSISSVTADADGNVVVAGANFKADSVVYFDGLPAVTQVLDSSTATVIPPPGASGQNATVTVYASDGQSSMFLGPTPPPTYSYAAAGGSAPPQVTFSPALLPAGVRAMVDIKGVNTSFVDGLTTVGFGSTDIQVRRVWVLNPTHLLVNVQIAANAQQGVSLGSVISGFQVATLPAGFQTAAPRSKIPVVEPTLINGVWLPSGVYPGAIVSLFGVNLGGSGTTITISGQPASILYASPGQINLVIPPTLKPGPAVLRLNNGTDGAYPVVISIDPAPPVIAAVQNAAGANLDASHAASAGDVLDVLVTGLANAGATVDTSRVRVTVGGADLSPTSIKQVSATTYQVEVTLGASANAGGQTPLTVSIDGRTSLPLYIPINPAAGSGD